MTELERTYTAALTADWPRARAEYKAACEALRASAAEYGETPIDHVFVPQMFTPADAGRLRAIAQTMYGIFEKIGAAYRTDASYRARFGFDRELETWMLADPGYGCVCPMARVDGFYDERTGAFRFCEFNTDGSSAMNEDRQLHALYRESFAWKQMETRYALQPFELFDRWVGAFRQVYADYASRHGKDPGQFRVVIADFMEAASKQEFYVFRDCFRRNKIACEVADVRSLRYKDGALWDAEGQRVDAVYRRAVTCDLLAHAGEASGFLRAAGEGAVCVVGGLSTQLFHDKRLFAELRRPETLRLLTEDERAFILQTVPETQLLRAGEFDRARVLAERERLILKPVDSYGGRDVFAGADCAPEEWARLVDTHTGGHMLVQEYAPPFETEVPDFTSETPKLRRVRKLTGLFLYAGQFAGMYSRLGEERVISVCRREMAAPTVVASPLTVPPAD